MAELYPRNERTFNGMISHMPGINAELRRVANELKSDADTRLEGIRGATQWEKFDRDAAHLMKIVVHETEGKYTQDYWVSMVSDDPEAALPGAFEYGHPPSGVFGPGGRLSHVKTRAPRARYLMTMTYVQA